MAYHEQYFQHAEGSYKPAALKTRPNEPLSFNKFERRVKFFLVEVLPKVVKFHLMLVSLSLQALSKLVFPAKKKSISGQVALVTGGGNGLGRALCLRLAAEGSAIAVADIDLVSARRTAEEVRDRFGVKAEAFRVDVGDLGSVAELRKNVESALGPVDILVNNAGLLAMLSLSEGKPTDIQRIVDVNLMSHFWTIREFKDGMVERRRGHIVGISSMLGIVPGGRTVCYNTTKFGVRGLMESLAEEIHLDGLSDCIHATCVYPAGIITRKEFVDFMKDLKVTIPWHSPEYVADAIIDGMLANEIMVVPSNLPTRVMANYFSLLPRRVVRLYADIFIGKVPTLTNRG